MFRPEWRWVWLWNGTRSSCERIHVTRLIAFHEIWAMFYRSSRSIGSCGMSWTIGALCRTGTGCTCGCCGTAANYDILEIYTSRLTSWRRLDPVGQFGQFWAIRRVLPCGMHCGKQLGCLIRLGCRLGADMRWINWFRHNQRDCVQVRRYRSGLALTIYANWFVLTQFDTWNLR